VAHPICKRITMLMQHHDGSPIEYRNGWYIRNWTVFGRWLATQRRPNCNDGYIMCDVLRALVKRGKVDCH